MDDCSHTEAQKCFIGKPLVLRGFLILRTTSNTKWNGFDETCSLRNELPPIR